MKFSQYNEENQNNTEKTPKDNSGGDFQVIDDNPENINEPEKKDDEKTNHLAMNDADFLDQIEPDGNLENEEEVVPENKTEITEEKSEIKTDDEKQEYPVKSEEKSEVEKIQENDQEKSTEEEFSEEKNIDYKSLYEQIMQPFKANGTEIKLNDSSEVISLMQLGANYTRKLQEMAPHRKIMTMLGNHDLLDESKLSLFIALDKGDPEAVKKFLADKEIDPLDIDTKTESTYVDGSYEVTDSEVMFRSALDELISDERGKETLARINNDWDQSSKDMLWDKPEVLQIIHSQNENGIYDKIVTEMNRQKVLGNIPATTPFLEAYKNIGDVLYEQGAFSSVKTENTPENKDTINSEQGKEPSVNNNNNLNNGVEKPKEETVVVTRAASPRQVVDNSDKAGAAAATRSSPGKAKEVKNFLSMSDEDFIEASRLQGKI